MKIDKSLKAKYFGKQRGNPKFIVVHYTANGGTTATAKSNANYFANGITRPASAHYCVDENPIIYQCVPDDYAAYAVGDNQKYTHGGATMKNVITNSNSISIEMVSHSDSMNNYYIPDATINHTIELIKNLQKQYNIPDANIYRHYDVTGKLCPQPYIDSAKWAAFKARLKSDKEVDTMLERILKSITISDTASLEKQLAEQKNTSMWWVIDKLLKKLGL